MQRLIDELLLLARCEAGLPSSEILDVRAVVGRAVSAVAVAQALAPTRVQVEVGASPLRVRGSAALLQRVVGPQVTGQSSRHNALRPRHRVRACVAGSTLKNTSHQELHCCHC